MSPKNPLNIKTKKTGKWAIGGSFALLMLLSINSCIDTRYDISKGISTKIAFGGDSLSIPLGSTDTIRVGDLLNADSIEVISIGEDGGYGIKMSDSIYVEVPGIDKSTLVLEDQHFKPEPIFVSFGDISLKDFSIPGIEQTSNLNLNMNEISLEDFVLPVIDETDRYGSGMTEYALDPEALEVNIEPVEAITPALLKDGYLTVLSETDPPIEVPLLLPNDTIGISTQSELSFSFDVPDGVSNIDTVELKKYPEKAVLKVELKLDGAVTKTDTIFTKGSIVPNVIIDPSRLFVFGAGTPLNDEGKIVFGVEETLSNENKFSAEKEMYIDAFKIEDEPVEGSIGPNETIRVTGYVVVDTLFLYSDKLNTAQNLNLLVEISINGVVIESMTFDLPELKTQISGSSPFILNDEMEEEVNKVNIVHLENPGSITVEISGENFPEMNSRSILIDSFVIYFPEEFILEPTPGLSDNKYTITNEPFDSYVGKKIIMNLRGLNMKDIALVKDGDVQSIHWEDSISFKGSVSINGRIDSKNIPAEGNDAGMKVQISSDLNFDYAEITTNEITDALVPAYINLSFDIDIAKEVKRLDTINMVENTFIHLNLDMPELPLDVEGDIKVEFPPLFSFKPALPNNELLIQGIIPETIDLELASLNINRTLSDGTLDLVDSIRISGDVKMLPGLVSSKDTEGLSSKTMAVRTTSDELKITSSSLHLNTLQANFSDSTLIEIQTIDLPKEILSLDSIVLEEGAILELTANITNMPELSSPLMLDFALKFPDLFVFMPGTVDAQNTWSFEEDFSKREIKKALYIKGLKFDGKSLGETLDINEMIRYNADVSVVDPSVISDDLTGDSISVGIEVKLSNVNFKSVYGKVDPGIKPEPQLIPIEGLPDFLKDTSIVLDINPVLSIQTASNLGIPVATSIRLIPVINDVDQLGKAQDISLNLTRSATAADTARNYFWIATDSAGMPDNYQLLQTNIKDLFSTIPEKLKIEIQAETDLSVQHEVDLDADYFMNVHYDVSVPLSFGKDFNLTIRDTINDLDPSIGEMAFAGGGLELYGSISNSIPMELDIQIIPINEFNETIPIEAVTQKIHSGKVDGSATDTDLSLKILDPDGLLKDLSGFILIFTASSNETVAGTPIKPENFVKATLKARLFGGIIIGE